jgi:hypothetical protein
MALLTALVAFIGRKLMTVVQAILGWSVTSIFGRLPSMKQTALSVALLISLLWPVAVLGLFFPAVSAWAFAMLPLQNWLGPRVVRAGTLALAILLPLAVGAITRWIAPIPGAPPWRLVISGYPLTLGFAAASLVTAVTVPLVRLSSAIRKWYDEHVFVQPREGEYGHALRQLVRACEASGIPVTVETVPVRMRIATTVLKILASGTVREIVSEDPKMLRGDGVELYLYPADLLLRGEPAKIACVRAAMTRTWLERYAFTVADPRAQELQERLQGIWENARRRGDDATGRLELVESLAVFAADLARSAVPFDQWIMLDHSVHRLEQVLQDAALEEDAGDGAVARYVGSQASPKPERTDRSRTKEASSMEKSSEPIEVSRAPEPENGSAQLVRKALEDTRKLVVLEVALARQEMEGQLAKAKIAGMSFGAAGALLLMSLTTFVVAGCMFTHDPPLAAVAAGAVTLSGAVVVGIVGWSKLPKAPLGETRERLEADLNRLKQGVGIPSSHTPANG